MFKNYLTVAIRNLIKQRSRTFISLFSLVVGMTCFILLMLYARYELSYDSLFERSDRIFQVGQYLPDWKFGGSNNFASTSGIVAPTLAAIGLFVPVFKGIAGNGIPISVLLDWRNAAGFAGLFLTVGFLAGAYPAFYLASLRPWNVLKSSFGPRSSAGQQKFCSALMIFQFGVTIILVVAAAAVQKQLLFIRSRDIGYSRDNVVAVKGWNDESRQNSQAIKRELLKNPLILGAAVANTAPLRRTEANDIKVETETGEMADVPMVTTYFIDEDYMGVMGMEITAGRNFSPGQAADIDRQVIVNETAARMAGLKDPIGKRVVKWGWDMRIIGVVKDFHFTSFRTSIGPLMFSYGPERSQMFLIKVAGREIRQTLGYIDAAFRRHSPNFTFDYAFMDDLYDRLYQDEGRWGAIILSFSVLAMVIAGQTVRAAFANPAESLKRE